LFKNLFELTELIVFETDFFNPLKFIYIFIYIKY